MPEHTSERIALFGPEEAKDILKNMISLHQRKGAHITSSSWFFSSNNPATPPTTNLVHLETRLTQLTAQNIIVIDPANTGFDYSSAIPAIAINSAPKEFFIVVLKNLSGTDTTQTVAELVNSLKKNYSIKDKAIIDFNKDRDAPNTLISALTPAAADLGTPAFSDLSASASSFTATDYRAALINYLETQINHRPKLRGTIKKTNLEQLLQEVTTDKDTAALQALTARVRTEVRVHRQYSLWWLLGYKTDSEADLDKFFDAKTNALLKRVGEATPSAAPAPAPASAS